MTTRIDEIRARIEKTRRVETQNRGGYIGVRLRSPFPREWESMTHCPSSSCMPEADAHAVVRMWAHAPGDLEFLLGEVERLTKERDTARTVSLIHETNLRGRGRELHALDKTVLEQRQALEKARGDADWWQKKHAEDVASLGEIAAERGELRARCVQLGMEADALLSERKRAERERDEALQWRHLMRGYETPEEARRDLELTPVKAFVSSAKHETEAAARAFDALREAGIDDPGLLEEGIRSLVRQRDEAKGRSLVPAIIRSTLLEALAYSYSEGNAGRSIGAYERYDAEEWLERAEKAR